MQLASSLYHVGQIDSTETTTFQEQMIFLKKCLGSVKTLNQFCAGLVPLTCKSDVHIPSPCSVSPCWQFEMGHSGNTELGNNPNQGFLKHKHDTALTQTSQATFQTYAIHNKYRECTSDRLIIQRNHNQFYKEKWYVFVEDQLFAFRGCITQLPMQKFELILKTDFYNSEQLNVLYGMVEFSDFSIEWTIKDFCSLNLKEGILAKKLFY